MPLYQFVEPPELLGVHIIVLSQLNTLFLMERNESLIKHFHVLKAGYGRGMLPILCPDLLVFNISEQF